MIENIIFKRLIVFLISMVPVLELRAAIPIGLTNELTLIETLILSLSGNIIIIPFVVILFNKILILLKKIKFLNKFACFLEERANRNSKKIQNIMFLGLFLFVAIPLPGTGAWTASMVAGITNIKLKKAFIPIALGVIVAAIIVTLVTYGVINIVSWL